jgi:hypothetical protein
MLPPDAVLAPAHKNLVCGEALAGPGQVPSLESQGSRLPGAKKEGARAWSGLDPH